jgi:signal transduction histidine kinase
MLQDFLTRERMAILAVAKQKALESKWISQESKDAETRWMKLYDRFATIVGMNSGGIARSSKTLEQDDDHLQLGFAVSEIVRTYSHIYRAITESARQLGYDITAEEFRQLNISLDLAISDVVNDFERVHSAAMTDRSDQDARQEAERLGFLVHELRNSLQAATLAFEMMETGILEPTGSTGAILKRSLLRLGELIDTALTGVRLKIEPELHLERISPTDVINEVGVTAGYLARNRDQTIRIQPVAHADILVDRALLVSAISNLVQNALKFSRPGGTIFVRTRLDDGSVVIEVEDECGGLDQNDREYLFLAGTQTSSDRTGLGLGLTIARQAIERNNGTITVTNLPGKGCIFVVSIPVA